MPYVEFLGQEELEKFMRVLEEDDTWHEMNVLQAIDCVRTTPLRPQDIDTMEDEWKRHDAYLHGDVAGGSMIEDETDRAIIHQAIHEQFESLRMRIKLRFRVQELRPPSH
ncbi:hypothetical protein JX265_013022 [Neoarthrinium moseri]|uniref:Uncharacterized protein n=2 Tax=Neoarthrinium moseri TaxID=1658444 RepID=A0A9Q0AJ72_9PEZI|nr:hypothetical protein JX265_013022 [Neoarthrinium moseri]